jgi:hypothetical protein
VGAHAGPDINENGLVLALDGANYRSFKGEATTNLVRNVRDFSGTQYGSGNEYTASPYLTVLTKTYVSSIKTPIGNGATLIQESGTAGYHHLSSYGGGNEDGLHSISCYVYPISSGITNFTFGLLNDSGNRITFDLDALTITYGGGISNRNAFITPVIGHDGWYRVGANIEGRSGGWVGCIGYSPWLSYTGTSGAKQCYITGIQYEAKSSPTSFVEAQTTRGTTVATGGGWADLTGNGNNGELVNGVRESADNLGSLSFDGSNDYITTGFTRGTLGNYLSISVWYKYLGTSGRTYSAIIGGKESGAGTEFFIGKHTGNTNIGIQDGNYNSSFVTGSNAFDGNWHQLVYTYDNGTGKIYLDSVLKNTGSFTKCNDAEEIVIGGEIEGSGYHFEGYISSVSFHNRVLTADEVKQNFNAQRGRFGI